MIKSYRDFGPVESCDSFQETKKSLKIKLGEAKEEEEEGGERNADENSQKFCFALQLTDSLAGAAGGELDRA